MNRCIERVERVFAHDKEMKVREKKIPNSVSQMIVQNRTGCEGNGRRAKGGSGGDAPLMTAEAALVATTERRNNKREAMVNSICNLYSSRSVVWSPSACDLRDASCESRHPSCDFWEFLRSYWSSPSTVMECYRTTVSRVREFFPLN